MNRFLVGIYLSIIGCIGYYYENIGSILIGFAMMGCFCELYSLTKSYLSCIIYGTIWFGPMILTRIYFPIRLIIKTAIIVSLFDMFQYIIGSNFGQHKYILISPEKTVEGYIGGYILSMILSFILNKNVYTLTIVYLVGILGDLLASWIKRVHCIKDFSNALGDHGGFIDRMDSILFVIPMLHFINI